MTNKVLVFLLLVFCTQFSFASEVREEKMNQCEKLVSKGKYADAIPMLIELLKGKPDDVKSQYLLAACYTADPTKINEAIRLLENAVKKAEVGVKIDIQVLLSRYYHQNYQFDEAITIYQHLDTAVSLTNIKSLKTITRLRDDYQVLIQQCNTAKKIIGSLTALEVKILKRLLQKQFLSSYRKAVGKEVWKNRSYSVKPSTMNSVEDAKENKDILIHSVGSGSTRFYAENIINKYGRRHKDLVSEVKEQGAEWFDRTYVGNVVNSPWDEDYPFLSQDSNTLYFASNGKESMGGYDIFRSERDTSTGYWGKPINLGFPINTPYDELMYMEDTLTSRAYFSSNRFSGSQSFDLFEWSIQNHEHVPSTFLIDRKVGTKGTTIKNINVANFNNPSYSATVTSVDNDSKYLLMVNQLERYQMDMELSNGERISSDVFSLSPKVSVGSSFKLVNQDSAVYVLRKSNISTGKRDSKMLKLLLNSSFGKGNDTIAANGVQSIVLSDSLDINLLVKQHNIVLNVLNQKEELFSLIYKLVEKRISDLAGWMQFKAGKFKGASKLHGEAETRLNYLIAEIRAVKELQKELEILQREEKVLAKIQLLDSALSSAEDVNIESKRINQLYKIFVSSFDSLRAIHKVLDENKTAYYNSLMEVKNKIEINRKAVKNHNLSLTSRLALLNEELKEAQRQQENAWWKRKKRRLQKTIDLITVDIKSVGKEVSLNEVKEMKRGFSVGLITQIFEVGDYRYSLPGSKKAEAMDTIDLSLEYLDSLVYFQNEVVDQFFVNNTSFLLPYIIVDEVGPDIVDSVFQIEEKELRKNILSLNKRIASRNALPVVVKKVEVEKDTTIMSLIAQAIVEDKEVRDRSLVMHKVKPKETIYYLARKYNVTVKEIKHWNKRSATDSTGIDWTSAKRTGTYYNWLYVGEKIKVYSDPQEKVHVVKSGENLRIIAQLYNMSKRELKTLNSLTQGHPGGIDWKGPRRSGKRFEWLYVGEKLIVQ